MRWYRGHGVMALATLPLLLWLAGCGGAGNEAAQYPSETTTQTRPENDTKSNNPSEGGERGKGKPGDVVESGPKVDPKNAIDIVKGDVKGGEAASGGTAEEFLYLRPDVSMIKDEPLSVEVPRGLQPVLGYLPAANPLTKGKVELGRQLYFEPRISLDGTVSCATCHNPNKGWTDNLKTSAGIGGQLGSRNAPTVLNTVYGKSMFWDGRAPSLEAQSQGPPQNPIEMGNQSYRQIVERLRGISGYREQFQQVFGTDVTLDGIAKAIASFERVSALSGDSAYDKYTQGQLDALNEDQKRGMVLFGLRLDPDDEFKPNVTLKKAECTSCHVGFNFTDEQFHNLGIGWNEKEQTFGDQGRFVIDPIGGKNLADLGAFKTPTVRDITRTGPYMHDGSLKTLEEVVEHYDKGGNPNPSLDKDMKKLNLTAKEKADLIAFMKALTGERIKVAMPTLPVGPDGKAPSPGDALAPPRPRTAARDLEHVHGLIAR